MNQQQLKEYTSKCHEAAKLNGWHEQTRTETEIILLIKSEMFEAFEAYRKQKYTSKNVQSTKVGLDFWNSGIFDKFYFETIIKDTFEDELADTAIRIFDAAGLYELEIYPTDPKKGTATFIECLSEFDTYSANMIGNHLLKRETKITNGKLSYLLDLVESIALQFNIDIFRHIDLKLEYNATRGKRHGGKIL